LDFLNLENNLAEEDEISSDDDLKGTPSLLDSPQSKPGQVHFLTQQQALLGRLHQTHRADLACG
jgi:hypothetical protein